MIFTFYLIAVVEEPPAVTAKTWLDILSEMYPSNTSVTSIQATTAPKPTPFDFNGKKFYV